MPRSNQPSHSESGKKKEEERGEPATAIPGVGVIIKQRTEGLGVNKARRKTTATGPVVGSQRLNGSCA